MTVFASTGAGRPDLVLFDACTLFNFCCTSALRDEFAKWCESRGDVGWVVDVKREAARNGGKAPPVPGASQAARLDGVLGPPIAVTDTAGVDNVLEILDPHAGGHPDEHRGEAASIVVARRDDAIFCSDDLGALDTAMLGYGLRTACTGTVIEDMIRRRQITQRRAEALLTAARRTGRSGSLPSSMGGPCHHTHEM